MARSLLRWSSLRTGAASHTALTAAAILAGWVWALRSAGSVVLSQRARPARRARSTVERGIGRTSCDQRSRTSIPCLPVVALQAHALGWAVSNRCSQCTRPVLAMLPLPGDRNRGRVEVGLTGAPAGPAALGRGQDHHVDE